MDIAFLFFTLNQQLPSVNILKDRHLLNSYFVQFFQAFRLREVVVYKNGIQVFHIRKANVFSIHSLQLSTNVGNPASFLKWSNSTTLKPGL